MASSSARRPVPALIALLVLLVLAGVVWWRVIASADQHDRVAEPCPTPTVATRLPAPAKVTVEVYNATTRAGIAGSARMALQSAGFDVPKAAGNDTKDRNKIKGVGQIRFGPAGKDAAQLLHYYLPGATLTPSGFTSATVVIALGLGFHAVMASDSVTAQLARRHIVAGSATPSPARTC